MQLFNTDIIPHTQDAMWTLPEALPDLATASTLVISVPFADGSPEAITLEKMMAACKLSPEQYVVIRLDDGQLLSWPAIRSVAALRQVLLLGISPDRLGIAAHLSPHQPAEFLGTQFLWSYSLSQIAQPEIKKAFWEHGLKPLFSIG